MSVDPENRACLSGLALEQIELCCCEFERQWQSGDAPDIRQSLLETDSEVNRSVLLGELLLLDMDYRRMNGESVELKDYLDIFPDDTKLVQQIFNSHGLCQTNNRALASETTLRNSPFELQPRQLPDRIGRYQILEPIGQGGFAMVYLAHDTELNRDVAVKIPHSNSAMPLEHANLFLQEARTLATLSHPSIAAVHDVGQLSDGRCYVITQLIEGYDLAKWAADKKPPLQLRLQIVIEIAEALHYAHESGFVHRDVKPSNILVDENDKPWLIDFGLALNKSEVGIPKMEFAGSRDYMSPEQIKGQGHLVDGRADIYSLGVVLYELATNQKPFIDQELDSLADKILHCEPLALRQLDDSIPFAVEQACLKAIEKRPQDRFATAKNFAEHMRNSAVQQKQPQWTRALIGSLVLLIVFLWPWINHRLVESTTGDSKPGRQIESIVVLPFNSLQLNSEDQYLGLSLSDAVATELSKSGKLAVCPTGSVQHLFNTDLKPVETARRFGVDAVVESSLRYSEGLKQIKLRILRTADRKVLWSGVVDESSIDNPYSMQNAVVQKIADALDLDTKNNSEKALTPNYKPDAHAYDAYLQGRFHWYQRSSQYSLENTVKFFEEAVEIDPGFALAYVALAECYALLDFYSYTELDGVLERTRATAEKALRLDPGLPDAYRALAFVEFSYGWNWERAEELYKFAIQMNPHDATARLWYGEMLMYQMRTDEAVVQLEWAARLNPLSEIICSIQGSPYLHADNFQTAREKFAQAEARFPESVIAQFGIARCDEIEGNYIQALKTYRNYQNPVAKSKAATIGMACCLARAGRIADAREIYDGLAGQPDGQRFTPYGLAAICVALGDNDKAFEWLNRAFDVKDDSMVMLAVDHRFDDVSSDPRFDALLDKMKLK